ncbi:MAG: M4 family metallopeptidase [Gammaproteobacteria bacterium]
MRKNNFLFAASIIAMAYAPFVNAAKAIDLSQQSAAILQTFAAPAVTSLATKNLPQLKQTSTEVDQNQTAHIRVQEMFAGYPVWGADAVVHVPHATHMTTLKNLPVKNANTTMNGIIYQDLAADFASAPNYIFTSAQADKALQQAAQLFQEKSGNKHAMRDAHTELMIFVDQKNKAHWAFRVSATVQSSDEAMPIKPTYILDAVSFEVYDQWNEVLSLERVLGGGYGGNFNTGRLSYDGLKNNMPKLNMFRLNKACFLQNDTVTVRNAMKRNLVIQFSCQTPVVVHDNEYWDESIEAVAGAYSPANDALYVGKIVSEMYQNWYGAPVLVLKGKPMMLNMRVHALDEEGKVMENAYWDGKQMSFGDGGKEMYPLVSLGIAAHEISHGYTQQHSGLTGNDKSQPAGLNESFSDMAAQAAEYYASGKNNWQIGPEVFKVKGQALRYMDQPTKDCVPGAPKNECSIDNVKDYTAKLDAHYSCGVFNKAFYLLSTSKDWTTKKAFDVMVLANKAYWTKTSTFQQAACGVMSATKALHYDAAATKAALNGVGLDC